jgi:hypothetical protein
MAAPKTAKRRLNVNVEVEGLNECLRAFSRFGRDANGELRDAAQAHARRIVPRMAAAAVAQGGPARAIAGNVKAPRDRVPCIAAGGTKRADVQRARRPPAGELVFGAEFGGGQRKTTRQFKAHRGHEGYWLYPTLRSNVNELFEGYQRTLLELATKWGSGG